MSLEFQDPQLSQALVRKTAVTAYGPVEYAEVGQGPVVVAVHGAMGGCDQSVILAQTIGEAGYRYLAVTRPGYLGTPLSSGRTAEQQGDLIAALLDTLGIARAGMMGVSGGGPCALAFGLRHPDRCAGLVLVSTCAGIVDVPIPWPFKFMLWLARRPWFARRIRKKAARNLDAQAARSIRDPEILARIRHDAATWPLFTAMMLSTSERINERVEGTANDIRISRTTAYPLEQLTVPVLVIHGTADRLLPFDVHARMFATRVPQAELVAIEGGEHVAIFTHRELVRPKVRAFMQRYLGPTEAGPA